MTGHCGTCQGKERPVGKARTAHNEHSPHLHGLTATPLFPSNPDVSIIQTRPHRLHGSWPHNLLSQNTSRRSRSVYPHNKLSSEHGALNVQDGRVVTTTFVHQFVLVAGLQEGSRGALQEA